MEHYSIRKMKSDAERQNIITGLARFQEVCVDGTQLTANHSLGLSLDNMLVLSSSSPEPETLVLQ